MWTVNQFKQKDNCPHPWHHLPIRTVHLQPSTLTVRLQRPAETPSTFACQANAWPLSRTPSPIVGSRQSPHLPCSKGSQREDCALQTRSCLSVETCFKRCGQLTASYVGISSSELINCKGRNSQYILYRFVEISWM